MAGANPRGDGEPTICAKCNEAFRLVSVLPMAAGIDYCPTCFEAYLGR
ncbi:hypothetical protein [Haloarcula litorea]|nr:hypothetical protein [Halomicroarcula sp. GDY20]